MCHSPHRCQFQHSISHWTFTRASHARMQSWRPVEVNHHPAPEQLAKRRLVQNGTSFTLNCAVYAFMMDLINKLWAYKSDRCVYKTATFYDSIKGRQHVRGGQRRIHVHSAQIQSPEPVHHKQLTSVTNGDIFRRGILPEPSGQCNTSMSQLTNGAHANILRHTKWLEQICVFRPKGPIQFRKYKSLFRVAFIRTRISVYDRSMVACGIVNS